MSAEIFVDVHLGFLGALVIMVSYMQCSGQYFPDIQLINTKIQSILVGNNHFSVCFNGELGCSGWMQRTINVISIFCQIPGSLSLCCIVRI